MAGDGPGDLYELADELRDICVEALDSIPGFTGLEDLAGSPDYVAVWPGAPLSECCDDGTLAIHVNTITDLLARTSDGGAPKLNLPNLIVTLQRCTMVVNEHGELMPAATIDDYSRQHHADGWALWNHIYNLIEQGEFLTRCQHVNFNAMIPLPLDGGCGGWQLSFTVHLDGYREVGT